MVGLKGMKDGRAILRIRAAIPWFFQGEGRWEAERRGSPPLPLFFLPFNPPLVWLNSARGTGKRFFYLISLPLLGEGTGAICLLLLSLSLLLTFFFFFFLCFSCRFSSRFDKKRNWENLKWRMTFFLVLWFDSGWKNRFVFFFFFVFLSSSYLPLRFSCRFLRKKIKRMIFFLISSSFLGGGVDVIRLLLIFFLSCFWCLFFSRFEKRNQENLKWKTIFLSDFVRFWVEEQMRFLFFWFLCFFFLSFFFYVFRVLLCVSSSLLSRFE